MADYGRFRFSGRFRLARAAVYATAIVTPLMLSGCQSGQQTAHIGPVGVPSTSSASVPPPTPSAPTSTATSSDAATPSSGAATATSSSPSPSSSGRASANGTAGTKLTISDGTSKVQMNGTAVDFGTEVHDLAWSPDGKKAAFIDGTGSLSVANPDGSGRVEVAKNTGK